MSCCLSRLSGCYRPFEYSSEKTLIKSMISIMTNHVCLQATIVKGPSIKYVTLFLANFYPLPPPVTLCHTSRDPRPPKYVTQLRPPHFRRPSTKKPHKN